MRSLLIVSEFAYPATATTSGSTPILLTGIPNAGGFPTGDEGVPGEDMGFPSSGSACAAVELEGVTSTNGDTIAVQASNNYFADSGVGETFAAAANAIATLPALTTKSKTIFLDRVALGEAMRIFITTLGAVGVGTVTAYLLNN